jgi:hypothetical protein
MLSALFLLTVLILAPKQATYTTAAYNTTAIRTVCNPPLAFTNHVTSFSWTFMLDRHIGSIMVEPVSYIFVSEKNIVCKLNNNHANKNTHFQTSKSILLYVRISFPLSDGRSTRSLTVPALCMVCLVLDNLS